MPVELTEKNIKSEVSDSKIPVIIKAYATWCGPCIQMTPIFEEVSKLFTDKVKFLELNVDQARDLAIQYGITSIPTMIFIKDGQIVSKETGFMDKETLQSKVEAFIK
jgi:thioredoxin 1